MKICRKSPVNNMVIHVSRLKAQEHWMLVQFKAEGHCMRDETVKQIYRMKYSTYLILQKERYVSWSQYYSEQTHVSYKLEHAPRKEATSENILAWVVLLCNWHYGTKNFPKWYSPVHSDSPLVFFSNIGNINHNIIGNSGCESERQKPWHSCSKI